MRHPPRVPFLTSEILHAAQPIAGPVRFSMRDTPQPERDRLYREFFGRAVMRYEVEPSQEVPLDIDVRLQTLPGLLMVTGRMHGSVNRRTRECVKDGLDDFGMAVNLGGKYVASQDGREIVLESGEATVISLGKPFVLMHRPPGNFLAMRFSRSQIMPRLARPDDICMRPIRADAPALSFLTGYVGIAQDNRSIADAVLQRAFVDHMHDLFALAVGATRDAAQEAQRGGLQAARLHAIKQEIGRRLGDPDLSVAALAARHACTARLIQRLFEAEGTTFTEYVLAQRLARAHRLLIDPRRDLHKISAVAYDCGFNDVSYFNRAFRRQFAAAPSDIRAQARKALTAVT